MQKVREFLIKQYAQIAITNAYWNYVMWHQIDDAADFDKDYCKMCEEMTANDVQQMAKAMLNGAYRIEITMLSEDE